MARRVANALLCSPRHMYIPALKPSSIFFLSSRDFLFLSLYLILAAPRFHLRISVFGSLISLSISSHRVSSRLSSRFVGSRYISFGLPSPSRSFASLSGSVKVDVSPVLIPS